jgi:hypothetical protein
VAREWDDMPEADLSGIQFPEDPDPTGVMAMVGLHKELFDAYMKVGFNRREALDLTCMAVTVMAMGD